MCPEHLAKLATLIAGTAARGFPATATRARRAFGPPLHPRQDERERVMNGPAIATRAEWLSARKQLTRTSSRV